MEPMALRRRWNRRSAISAAYPSINLTLSIAGRSIAGYSDVRTSLTRRLVAIFKHPTRAGSPPSSPNRA